MQYNLIFLLGNHQFPVSSHLFGQTTILLEIYRFLPVLIGKKVNLFILAQTSNYAIEVEKIIKKNNLPTIVLSMMFHEDAEAVYKCSLLKHKYQNFFVIIGLYCTASEFIYRQVNLRRLKSDTAIRYSKRKNQNTRNFVKYLKLMKQEELIDRFVFDSKFSYQTYQSENIKKIINLNKAVIIKNGVDENLIKPLPKNQKIKKKVELGLHQNDFIVGFASRFTQYKGSDILKEILNFYDSNWQKSPVFLLPIYPNGNTKNLLTFVVEKKNLFASQKIKFYLDMSKQIRVGVKISGVLESYLKKLINQHVATVKNNFLGILNFPSYQITDVLLRPSLIDALPLTILESYLANCPVIATDRTGFYWRPKKYEVVHLPNAIKVFNKYLPYQNSQYKLANFKVANQFISRIEKLRTNPQHFDLRTQIIKGKYTAEEMVKRYLNLFNQVLDNN